MSRALTILDTLDDPQVFAPMLEGGEWGSWRAFLAALFGLPLDKDGRVLYRQCTGRKKPRKGGHDEAWLVIGRRGGKSFMLALIAVFLAGFRDWRPCLGPGERATIMIIAADRKQARVILRYVTGLLEGVPMLARTIEAKRSDSLDLANRVTVEVHTASFRTVRGYSIVAALLDEIAFWRSEDAANPDTEIVNALRPAMATVPGSVMLAASSPYARRGALWQAYRQHYGQDSRALVWQANTRTMNPTVPEHVVARAYEADPAAAAAEWGAEFRKDVESFIPREAVEACVVDGRRELPPVSGVRYQAFVDPSGGSSDSFTLAIGHREGDRRVIDAIRETRPPFNPSGVVGEFAELLKAYGIREVVGDRYGGEWPREQFRAHGITYRPADKDRSALYGELLPMLNSGTAELLDHKRQIDQIVGLERRMSRAGKDRIDHGPGGHDDVANAAAGLLSLLETRRQKSTFRVTSVGLDDGDINAALFSDAEAATYEPADDYDEWAEQWDGDVLVI